MNGCQGHSWKATAVWIVSGRRSRQLIIVSLAHSQITIAIDKESRLLIAPHFINFAPQGLAVATAAAVTRSAILIDVIRIQKSSHIIATKETAKEAGYMKTFLLP